MRITAEFKDLNEFMAFVKAKGIDDGSIHGDGKTIQEIDPNRVVGATLEELKEWEKEQATPAEAAEAAAPTEAELESPPQPEPEEEPTYSLGSIQKAAADLLTKNKSLRPLMKDKLKEYKVGAMRELPVSKYGEFAGFLRELGAAI